MTSRTKQLKTIRENLVRLDGGIYLSRTDPQYWEKYLQYSPNSAEAMYHVGLNLEEKAKGFLEKYYETKSDMYFNLYKTNIAKAYDLLNKSWKVHGYTIAKEEVERVKDEVTELTNKLNKNKNVVNINKKDLIIVILITFILGLILAFLWYLLPYDKADNHKAYIIPYTIQNEYPISIPEENYDIKVLEMENTTYMQDKEIANKLVGMVRAMYEKDHESPKKVIGVISDDNGMTKEVGTAVWTGENSNIKVYVYQDDKE